MNRIIRNILLTAKDIAIQSTMQVVPGSALVISGVQKLLDKDDHNNAGAIEELGVGVIAAIESIKGEDVADEVMIASGVVDIKLGFAKIQKGLKAAPPSPTL